MKKATVGALMLTVAAVTAGCGSHTYGVPVVVPVQTGPDQEVDVAWIVEDNGRVLRCVNAPDRPRCRRANVD